MVKMFGVRSLVLENRGGIEVVEKGCMNRGGKSRQKISIFDDFQLRLNVCLLKTHRGKKIYGKIIQLNIFFKTLKISFLKFNKSDFLSCN